MQDFNIVSGTTHLAVVTQHTESLPVSGHDQSVTPVSVPSYLGGATIAVALVGMIAVAVQAAGFTSKSTTPKRQRVAVKHRSFANHRSSVPH